MAEAKRPWLTHPVRLSGFVALTVLLGPGSLMGLSMLLAHAGLGGFLPGAPPRVHALLQGVGFFLVLIWGFLVHGLPGMLAADPKRTARMRLPMFTTGAAALAVWAAEAYGLGRVLAWGAFFISVAAGSLIMLDAALRAKLSWRERPFPMLIFPLAFPPVAVAVAYFAPQGALAYRDGADLLLFGCLVPVIVSMGFRMFPAMIGLRLPHERAFDVAAAAWFAGLFARVAWPGAFLASDVLLLGGALGFIFAKRIFVPRRSPNPVTGTDRALYGYVRTGYALLALAPMVDAAGQAGWLGGVGYYWSDAARHLVAIGFVLLLVMGITQRVLPTYLRGRRAVPAVMWLVWLLVAGGVVLRLAEGYLPATGALTAASAIALYAGVIAYGLHLLRGMIFALPRTDALHSRHRNPAHADP